MRTLICLIPVKDGTKPLSTDIKAFGANTTETLGLETRVIYIATQSNGYYAWPTLGSIWAC